MKNKKMTESTRQKLLVESIHNLFIKDPCAGLKSTAIDYDDVILEMFTISEIYTSAVVLEHFFQNEIFFPVIFNESLLPLLKTGDLFLMKIGLTEGRWHVLDMSQPYH